MAISTSTRDVFSGCLLGGAIGDALGEPIEFLTLEEIKIDYGEQGIKGYVADKGIITDDTQMTLFTAEGLIRAMHFTNNSHELDLVPYLHESYLRWYITQEDISTLPRGVKVSQGGYLFEQRELFKLRAPGMTCLSALNKGYYGRFKEVRPINNSKGCGGVMRAAPVGLMYYDEPEFAFELGMRSAAITHGHPSGYFSAGAFACIIAHLVRDKCSLMKASDLAIKQLQGYPRSEEVIHAIKEAQDCSGTTTRIPQMIKYLGQGWVAEEALSIALYCALIHEHDFEKGVLLAVNHDGDSDSTGSMTGNLLGAIHGTDNILEYLIENLELKDVISQVAIDIHTVAMNKELQPKDIMQRYVF